MEDLDALLADLQQTTAHLKSPSSMATPIYQNQEVIREVTTTTTTTTTNTYPRGPPAARSISPPRTQQAPRSISPPRPPPPASPRNKNLSDLDTLLKDLNSARFMPFNKATNGSTSPQPWQRSHSPAAGQPSVETLLDDLQSAVPLSHPHYKPSKETITTVSYAIPERYPPPMASSASKEHPPTMASSATKELEDLLISLSDFKVDPSLNKNLPLSSNQMNDTATYAKPHAPAAQMASSQLDSMLGSLQSDMSKQGVSTTAKGHCAACNKPIVGQVVTAMGKTWHSEHFTCHHCNTELSTKTFFERDGKPYCETDYHNIFSPRCAYCNGPILDKCVTALDKTWHPEHFFCTQCGRQFGEEGFHERDGQPYCRTDFLEMFAPKCGGCNRPITENYISALNSQWHPDCFVCRDCLQPFNGGSFYDHEGQPYCETHYHAKRGSLCAGCHKPITGRCVTAMFRKFHPEHFVCSFCLKQLNKGTFKEQNDKPYCHACFDKLYG